VSPELAFHQPVGGLPARWLQPEQHGHHHQVARAERTIEPVSTPEATGKFTQPVTHAILLAQQLARALGNHLAPAAEQHAIPRSIIHR
jgi:hypothetical protein